MTDEPKRKIYFEHNWTLAVITVLVILAIFFYVMS